MGKLRVMLFAQNNLSQSESLQCVSARPSLPLTHWRAHAAAVSLSLPVVQELAEQWRDRHTPRQPGLVATHAHTHARAHTHMHVQLDGAAIRSWVNRAAQLRMTDVLEANRLDVALPGTHVRTLVYRHVQEHMKMSAQLWA